MLTILPYEVLESISSFAANGDDYLDSLSTLVSIFLSCRTIHNKLLGAPSRGLPRNDALLARLLDERFDTAAIRRRLARGKPIPSDIRAEELKKRVPLLRRIRNKEFRADYLVTDFISDLWNVYLMLLEDDGKNLRQLEHVGVEQWAKDILRSVVANVDEDGWPVENLFCQLVTAILAIVCDRAAVMRESQADRQLFLDTLHDFFIAPHRYPITHFPITMFGRYRPQAQEENTLLTLATMPVYEPTAITYFGRKLTLSAPLLSESAICATAIRNERMETNYSRNIPLNRAEADAVNWPWGLTQTDWIESNLQRRQGLGVEVPRAGGPDENLALLENPKRGSERWDGDFWRMVHAANATQPDPTADRQLSRSWFGTVYEPGIVTGKWVGRLIMPSWRAHTRMLHMHPAPLNVVYAGLEEMDMDYVYQFMQMNLREHIAADSMDHVSTGEHSRGDGIQNAWFPTGLDPSRSREFRENGTELVLRDPHEPVHNWATKRYKTWYPGMEFPEAHPPPAFPLVSPPRFASPEPPTDDDDDDASDSGDESVPDDVEMDFREAFRVIGPHPDDPDMDLVEYDDTDVDMEDMPDQFDVIVTGETDYPHGKAYGAYKVYGRVRKHDGLVVFVRAPQADHGGGRWIFRGYFRGGAAIIGRWRESAADLNAGAYEGPFVLCKVGETWGPYGV